jgi:hypothetical protein
MSFSERKKSEDLKELKLIVPKQYRKLQQVLEEEK